MAWIDKRVGRDGKARYYVKDRRPDRSIYTSEAFSRKQEALARKGDLEQAHRRGTSVDSRKGKVELRPWLEKYIAGCPATSTRNAFTVIAAKHISPTVGLTRLSDLDELTLEQLFHQMQEAGVGVETQIKAYRLIHAALVRAVKRRLIHRNPLLPMEDLRIRSRGRASKMRFLTAAEAGRLTSAIDGEEQLLTRFMIGTGARVGEAIEIRVGDLDLTKGVVVISRSATESHGVIEVKSTKSGKGREVPLPAVVRDPLRDHLTTTGRRFVPEALVFQTARGHQIRPSNFRSRTLAVASERAGLERVKPHDLRSTFASINAHAKVDVYRVSRWLGHGSIAVTEQRYVGLFSQGSEDASAIDAAMREVATQ